MLHSFSSLRLRAEIASVVVVLALALFSSFNASRIVLDGGEAEAEANIKQMAQLLNLAVSPYASMGGLPVLEDFLDGMFVKGEDNGLVYLVIRSESGQVLLKAGKIPDPLPEPDASVRDGVARGIVHVRNYILLRGNHVGTFQFGLSTRHVADTQKAIEREGLAISGGIAALILAIIFAIGLTVSRRIDRLIEASRQIAGGHYEAVRADDRGNDEISALARNFNQMAGAISEHMREVQESRRKVEEINASLEDVVALRTRQLEDKNAELASTIDNLHETRESLVRSEKLAGLGAVVAGVAHELNTPIGNALTVSTTQREKTRVLSQQIETGVKRSTLQQYLEASLLAADMIERNLMRAAELVQGFKQVAVDQSSDQKRAFNLKDSIGEYLLMLHPMLKKTPYRVEVEYPGDLTMNSYPGALGQMVTNFVNNSLLHGFDGRGQGVMRIRAEALPDGWLRLEYGDDGRGIPAENLGRVFDPFFTTRLGQGGSGLGLNIVFNIATKLLGGTIDVHSAPDQGTTFVLVLPREAPAAADGGS